MQARSEPIEKVGFSSLAETGVKDGGPGFRQVIEPRCVERSVVDGLERVRGVVRESDNQEQKETRRWDVQVGERRRCGEVREEGEGEGAGEEKD